MKIIIPLAVNFGFQGGFRVLSNLANSWIDSGHDVNFLVYQKFVSTYFPTQANILKYDSVGNLINENESKKDSNYLGTLQLRWAMKKALNKLSADIVLATQCYSAGPVFKSVIDAKKFYYIQAYEPEFYNDFSLKNIIYKYIAKKSYSYPLEKIVNSQMYFNYKEIKADKVVLPGLDFELFFPKKDSFTSKSKYIIGTIGRLEKIKGTQYILDAFIKLREKFQDKIELIIAFGDDSWNQLDGVKVIKPNGDSELGEYYRSIDVYICAGTFQLEAVHYPVIEAMASKTPVISTGYYPTNEDNSLLIETKSSMAIVNAVEEIINDPDETENRANRALLSIEEFRWDFVSKKMLDYFKA